MIITTCRELYSSLFLLFNIRYFFFFTIYIVEKYYRLFYAYEIYRLSLLAQDIAITFSPTYKQKLLKKNKMKYFQKLVVDVAKKAPNPLVIEK